MTRHAQPLAILRDPGIGKAPEMFIGLAAIGAFRMISTRHDRGRGIHFYLHVIDTHDARLKLRVGEIRQELASIADRAVVFSIDKLVADHASDGGRIAAYLGLVPHPLEPHLFSGGFPGEDRLRSLRERAHDNEKAAGHRLHDRASVSEPYPHFLEL